MMLKYIPNVLTLFRFTLIVPFLIFIYHHNYNYALYTFILAGFTDGLDGWLARHYHWRSFVGSIVDPMADKLLVIAGFISLALIGIIPWWLVFLVVLKDFTLCMGVIAWYVFVQRKLYFVATWISKVNTTVQLGLVTLCLIELGYYQFNSYFLDSMIYLTAFTTSLTYIDYVWTWSRKAWPQKQLS
jgi:cardiolipin synthase